MNPGPLVLEATTKPSVPNYHWRRGNGQIVSVLVFYSDDTRSNPSKSTVFTLQNGRYRIDRNA